MTFPAGAWSNGTKQQAGGNFAGVNIKRDIPTFVRLIESGRFDAKSLATAKYPVETRPGGAAGRCGPNDRVVGGGVRLKAPGSRLLAPGLLAAAS